MRRSSNSKKANAVLDSLMMIVVLFAFAIITIIMFPTFTEFRNDIVNDPDMDPVAQNEITKMHNRYVGTFDAAFITLLMVFWVGALILSYFIDAHPVLWVIVMILLILVFWVGGILANAYDDITGDEEFQSARDNFALMNFVMSNYMEIMIIAGCSIAVALFMRVVQR